jgi:hypothetical protein
MARKGSWAALHHKGLEPENVRRQRGQISLGYYTNTKGKPKVQPPTKVVPKEENYQMVGTKKMALCHQGKSCFCRGRDISMWFCATKENHACSVDGMLKGGFVLPRQIMFVPQMVCKKTVL